MLETIKMSYVSGYNENTVYVYCDAYLKWSAVIETLFTFRCDKGNVYVNVCNVLVWLVCRFTDRDIVCLYLIGSVCN